MRARRAGLPAKAGDRNRGATGQIFVRVIDGGRAIARDESCRRRNSPRRALGLVIENHREVAAAIRDDWTCVQLFGILPCVDTRTELTHEAEVANDSRVSTGASPEAAEPEAATTNEQAPKRKRKPRRAKAQESESSGSSAGKAGNSATSGGLNQGVSEVLELFRTRLSDVEFPGLGLDVLESAAKELEEQAEAVEAAREQLNAAEEAREEARGELERKCRRALAYARVFAEEDESLAEELAGVQFPKQRKPAGGRGRSRSE